MIPSLSIGPRTLLKDCNHSATAMFWRSAIHLSNGGELLCTCHSASLCFDTSAPAPDSRCSSFYSSVRSQSARLFVWHSFSSPLQRVPSPPPPHFLLLVVNCFLATLP